MTLSAAAEMADMAVLRSRLGRALPGGGERGFTLVELSVAIAVLLVGVLGTVALVDGASQATAANRARESATALARELIELTRAIPYDRLTADQIAAELQARPGLADASPEAGWTLERRGFTYTVSLAACAVDDARDGLGLHGASVPWCPQSAETGDLDRNPDDYRRVTVTLTWQASGKSETARQTTLVINPAGGLGPSVRTLTPVPPAGEEITDPSLGSATFELTTSATPATVEWYVNGAPQGRADGSGNEWSFTWPLGNVLDGTYLVQARAFNEDGRSGVARVLTVVLNRHAPLAPSGVGAGRNGRGTDVDIEWNANGEGDVVGYRVYRTDALGTPLERACPPASGSASFLQGRLSCVDEGAPPGELHYAVVALDRDPDGNLREGEPTTVPIAEGNTPPAAPTGLRICAGGTDGCVDATGAPAPPGTTVLSWDPATDPDGDAVAFYRIYRDGTGYEARYDRLYASASALVWIDDDPGGAEHEYRVTAVDERFGESAPSEAVRG